MRLIDANKLEKELNLGLDENTVLLEFDDNLVHSGERLGIKYCLLKLKESPTIDPDSLRQHGEWIDRGKGYICCSECEYHCFGYEDRSPYCHRCGTKMEGKNINRLEWE